MIEKPVGIIWDSVSNNTGDIAIGMFLKRFCETRGIDYRVVDPFAFDPTDYSTFIVGGGQLLRASDEVLYQGFRIPGPQILNSVGIYKPDHLEYLRDYRMVSVRSQAEKNILTIMLPDLQIEVSPCNTIQMEPYFSSEIAELRSANRIDQETIGIHLNHTTFRMMPDLLGVLRELSQKYKLLFLPFTYYEGDHALMEMLVSCLPGSRVASASETLALFAIIGQLKAMVTSSMHAAMFAYVQNVPVLAFPQDQKLRYFFEERGYPNCLYTSAADLLPRLEELLQNPPDFSQSVQHDRELVETHLAKIEQLVKEPVKSQVRNDDVFKKSEYNELRRRFYSAFMQNLLESNASETRRMELEHEVAMEREKRRVREKQLAELTSSLKFVRFPLSRYIFKLLKGRAAHNRRAMALIKSSLLFDEQWYLAQYPDVAASNLDAALHYLLYGGFEGRDPGPNFSSAGYLRSHPEVVWSGENPLIHYLTSGKRDTTSHEVEGRKLDRLA